MSELKSPSTSADWGYGDTPEDALWSVLRKQPAFEPTNPEYVGERPGFMDVRPENFHEHDWDQYRKPEGRVQRTPGDAPIVSAKNVITPVSESDELRKRISLDNVWIEVDDTNGRVEVLFQFRLQMRQSAWDGDDKPRPDDLQWSCERVSTEPIS